MKNIVHIINKVVEVPSGEFCSEKCNSGFTHQCSNVQNHNYDRGLCSYLPFCKKEEEWYCLEFQKTIKLDKKTNEFIKLDECKKCLIQWR